MFPQEAIKTNTTEGIVQGFSTGTVFLFIDTVRSKAMHRIVLYITNFDTKPQLTPGDCLLVAPFFLQFFLLAELVNFQQFFF